MNFDNHPDVFIPKQDSHAIAFFGAGCFWGVEHKFLQCDGVLKTAVGYGGGHTINPTYRSVCYEDTNHAELVHLLFDKNIIAYTTLVGLFFDYHNPTQLNRQGVDIGTQYRSVIFYCDDKQYHDAKNVMKSVEKSSKYNAPIVTQIKPFINFTRAEEYHQQYILKQK